MTRVWTKRMVLAWSLMGAMALGVAGCGTRAASSASSTVRFSFTLPAPARVTVNPATTALILIDYVPKITHSHYVYNDQYLKPSQSLLAKARHARMLVIHTTVPGETLWTPGFAPKAGEPVVSGYADKYHQGHHIDSPTKLLPILQRHHIRTVIIAGATTSVGVYLTTDESLQQGLTVIIPENAVSDVSATQNALALYELWNSEVYKNLHNRPDAQNAVTLTSVGRIRAGT